MEQKSKKQLEYDKPTICTKCGAPLEYLGIGYYRCTECGEELKDRFCQIKEYLEAHPKATAVTVSKELGIDLSYINKLLRMGRLEIPEDSDVFIGCELCGRSIRYGRVCSSCAATAGHKIQGVAITPAEIGETPKKTDGKMRYITEEKRHH